MAKEITTANFETEVLKSEKPVLIDFWATWCGPCMRQCTVVEELAEDIANGYKKVIRDLYDAGCRSIQLDDCSWGMCVDHHAPTILKKNEAGLQKIMEQLLAINNRAIEGAPEDLVINTHVCRGNFHSTYASSGAYDRVAEALFARENVSAYYLEFDDARSGGFEPLKSVSGD